MPAASRTRNGRREQNSVSLGRSAPPSSVVLRAEISLSYEDFRRVVRGVWGEALQQQHPSPAEPIMNLWFRLCRAGFSSCGFAWSASATGAWGG